MKILFSVLVKGILSGLILFLTALTSFALVINIYDPVVFYKFYLINLPFLTEVFLILFFLFLGLIIGLLMDRQQRKSKYYKELIKIQKAEIFIQKTLLTQNDNQLIYDNFCKILIERAGYRYVWIGTINDTDKEIQLIASSGLGTAEINPFTFTWDDTESGNGFAGTAIKTGKLSFSNNISCIPGLKEWKSFCKRNILFSCLSLPLKFFGDTIGVIEIYSSFKNSYDSTIIEILADLSSMLSQKIESIRLDNDRKQIEADLSNAYRNEKRKADELRDIFNSKDKLKHRLNTLNSSE